MPSLPVRLDAPALVRYSSHREPAENDKLKSTGTTAKIIILMKRFKNRISRDTPGPISTYPNHIALGGYS